MLKRIFTIVISALAIILVNGCENQLDIVNPNKLGSQSFYKTQNQAVAAVDAIYNTLIIDGLYQRMTPAMSDGRGDEVSSRSPWPWLSGLSNFTVPSTDGAGDIAWSGYYIMVSRANQAITYIPNVPDVDENLRSRLMGQAYFLRALAYFNLTNLYDKIPLTLSVPAGEESFYPSNADVTQDMVYDQVQLDLEQATANLPANYTSVTGPDNGQVGRATKGAALAMLGKLNLYRKNYTQAGDYFKQVIDGTEYTLMSNYDDLFNQDPAVEATNHERIFWAEFTTSDRVEYNWGGDPDVNWRQFSAIAPTYSVKDFFDFYPTAFLYNEMRVEKTSTNHIDPRFFTTLLAYDPAEGHTTGYGGVDWATLGFQPADFFIKKYTLAGSGGDPFRCGINYSIIRYADVLLMYAECLANTSDMANAAKYVQEVRDRANLPDREAEFAGYSLSQFMTQLAHERVCELGIEGIRFYDLMRWGWLDDPAKVAILKTHDQEFNNFSVARKYMPIPQTDLDRDPNLVGNSAD